LLQTEHLAARREDVVSTKGAITDIIMHLAQYGAFVAVETKALDPLARALNRLCRLRPAIA
jgi:hypothetical protein